MELLERFAAGDLDAFEALFRQYQGDVYRWIVRIVRDSGIAEDLTVETFWRIYCARARFDPKGNFRAWARRIATNAALDYLRTKRPESELPSNLLEPERGDPAVRGEIREQIARAFRELPAKLRLTAALALIEEIPYVEIAEELGTSVGAVKVRVHRAVRQLRKSLQRAGVHA